jgi:hypothetical protein
MGVQDFLKGALKRSMETFDAEEILIEGQTVLAIIDETSSANPLGTGAKKDERELTVQFAAADFQGKLKSGMKVTARDEVWQISAEDGGIRKGQVAVTVILVEPGRRPEF